VINQTTRTLSINVFEYEVYISYKSYVLSKIVWACRSDPILM